MNFKNTEMKKIIIIKNRHTDEICGKFDTKTEAVDAMNNFIDDNNEGLDDTDSEYLTMFDFAMEIADAPCEINETVTSYESAMKYLGIDETDCVQISGINPKHKKAIIAMNKLFTIAEAWNKADGFIPDYSDRSQWKWWPWFVYKPQHAGFVCANTLSALSSADATLGSRLCFKTENRARQFGEQFIDLWNDVLLFR
jgi:hypothetical protein